MFGNSYYGGGYYGATYFGPVNEAILAAAILGAGAAAGPEATEEEILRAKVAWDDREVFELITIIFNSGIIK